MRIAREHDVLAHRHRARSGRAHLPRSATPRVLTASSAPHVVRNHVRLLRQGLRGLEREGFRQVCILHSPEAIDAVAHRARRRCGPTASAGDRPVRHHRRRSRLLRRAERTARRSWAIGPTPRRACAIPRGGASIFLGDLVDRGPKVVETVDLVRRMVAAGQAFCVPGNHDVKLLRYLKWREGADQPWPGREHRADRGAARGGARGLARGLSRLRRWPRLASRAGWRAARRGARRHEGRNTRGAHRAVCATSRSLARRPARPTSLACPCAPTGPRTIAARRRVVYGHTPVPDAVWLNNTINIDTGCVFGGRLTALRWPERELVSVAAHQTYAQPVRPLATLQAGQR